MRRIFYFLIGREKNKMNEKVKIGVSACLLGERVRYDGGHKYDGVIVEAADFVEWVSVCPEVECGMTVPREPIQLERIGGDVRLMGLHTRVDYTLRMMQWIESRLVALEKEGLCGFVFKSKSPSCGLRDIPVFDAPEKASAVAQGLFAKVVTQRFPWLPVEDEERLRRRPVRENFFERAAVCHEWQKFFADGASVQKLAEFHAQHKDVVMARSKKHLAALEELVARPNLNIDQRGLNDYFSILMQGLAVGCSL